MATTRRSLMNLIYNRRSIRRFKPVSIPDEAIEMILEAGQRAPTACSFQAYFFVVVKDPEKRHAIARLHGQEFILNAPAWIVVCADLNRLERTLDFIGHDHVIKHDSYIAAKVFSVFDAALAAENMVLATENLGLGSVFTGILEEAEEVSSILKLPDRVLPLVLLCVGEPDERPPKRPRWPLRVVTHEDEYKQASKEEIKKYLDSANEALKEERYYLKYDGREYDHTEYLRLKTLHSRDRSKWNKTLTKFIQKSGFKI